MRADLFLLKYFNLENYGALLDTDDDIEAFLKNIKCLRFKNKAVSFERFIDNDVDEVRYIAECTEMPWDVEHNGPLFIFLEDLDICECNIEFLQLMV